MRDEQLLEIVFRMEEDRIVFVGDFVQMQKSDIDTYTCNTELTESMVSRIGRYSLTTGMIVRRWNRPSTSGITM
jgi:hypothetical protein